jgi:2-(1,2-epoxy-1,2-dihydrophenyl)acetyl-CoA isomerase
MRDHLADVFDELSATLGVRVVVLTGAGDRHFCTGAGLGGPQKPEPPRPADAPEKALGDVARMIRRGWQRLVASILDCEKPVIAAVNGPAAGAGFGLALAADIRLVSASARLTAGYVRRALSPDAGVSYFLPRLIGSSRATEILFTGRDIDAGEAERIGLASMVIADDGFGDHVHEYAERLAAGPPVALALTKRLLTTSLETTLEAQLERELAYIKTCFASSDVAEAMGSFTDKRRPVFKGR